MSHTHACRLQERLLVHDWNLLLTQGRHNMWGCLARQTRQPLLLLHLLPLHLLDLQQLLLLHLQLLYMLLLLLHLLLLLLLLLLLPQARVL